jgi:hypothetical protein
MFYDYHCALLLRQLLQARIVAPCLRGQRAMHAARELQKTPRAPSCSKVEDVEACDAELEFGSKYA